MPSINDVMEMVELFKVKQLYVDQDKCSAVRNRNSSCRKCADICFTNAVKVEKNQVTIDSSACVNCGACVAICPPSAITAVELGKSKLANEVLSKAKVASGIACFACLRRASKHEGDEEKFATLPCLAHISEHLICDIVAAGCEDIVLVDGVCETCKYGAVSSAIDDTVENAARLLEAVGSGAAITRTNEFPEELQAKEIRNIRGADRRGLMFQTGSYLKTVATNVAQKTIEDNLGIKKEPLTLHDRLSAGKSGRMPTFVPEGNMKLLDDMSSIGEPVVESIDTRRFGSVEIDSEKCSGCGLCVLFCPTKALSYDEYEDPENEEMRYLEFRAADCTQCRLCEDVCLRKCLTVSGRVKLADLFDFEPKLIEIPRPKERQSFLSLKRS